MIPETGMTRSEPFAATFEWRPEIFDAPSAHAITVLYRDSDGLEGSCSFALEVRSCDGEPDDVLCPRRFVRGDGDASGGLTISDAILILRFLFRGSPPRLDCEKTADANDDGLLNVTDPVYLLRFLFNAGTPPRSPWPDCAEDATEDSITCTLPPACA
jgi:hypothetical protein